MHVVVIGLNVGNASLSLRERLAFTDETLHAGLAAMRAVIAMEGAAIAEAAILSTCHRLELIAVTRDPEAGERALVHFLAGVRDVPAEAFAPYLTRRHGEAAIAHLFALAAGLDSPVLGDSQILGQVAEAYAAAREAHTTGPMLAALFQHAMRAAKRVHTETTLNRHVSVGYTAAALALETAGTAGKRALVIGAGKMGQWAARYLHAHGVSPILIVNRRLAQAQTLAERVGGVAVPWEELSEALACADVAISTTAAPQAILTREEVAAVMRRRPGRPLHFVDIAVPRDIEAAVSTLPNVRVTTVDDLATAPDTTPPARQAEVPRAAAIVAAEIAAFGEWLRVRAVVPTVRAIRGEAERIRQAEVQRFLTHDVALSERDQQRLDALTKAIVNKLLHQPTVRLKAMAGTAEGLHHAEIIRDLFGLGMETTMVDDGSYLAAAAAAYLPVADEFPLEVLQ